ncbi:DUF1491 family protein [Roseibium aggregatum]|uniref:DUF1491 family protein n=1 Tax=Roseibium aggregatum TaxID=187304 RepID=A0A926S4L4_9HYPH|nr:DUF1491 family protein [Roseibium aggregatum]MBD1545215.1 DUF1491 family protein [Roseibium aggregatum]
MRVTSDFFVSALVRKTFTGNGFAAVSKRGSAEAGAIFIVVDRLDGTYDFYGPAPQAMFSDQPQGRLFEKILERTDRTGIDDRLAREARMDPDYWVVDIEARDGAVDLPLAEDEGGESKDDPAKGLFRF